MRINTICALSILVCLLLAFNGSILAQGPSQPFRQALPGYRFSFPRDHAAHPDFKTEWWYYTGHLQPPSGAPFGYELTFFRTGLPPQNLPTQSRWALTQVYPAHFAISDEGHQRFFFTEKLNRAGLGIAGAESQVYRVWNETWFAEQLGNSQLLHAEAPEYSLHLLLTPQKAPVIHGKNGVSQKASCTGCASHYYSMTRLQTQGILYQAGKPIPVKGISWMDHEFGSNQLAQHQVGWDWFSIQLQNGSELMLYLLRTQSGTLDPNSSGTWISQNGQAQHLTLNQFQVKSTGSWTSPTSKAKYPMGWQINLPSQQLSLTLTPAFQNQELATRSSTGVIYWEGSTHVSGTQAGKPIKGQAYVEMTGYAQAFKQRL